LGHAHWQTQVELTGAVEVTGGGTLAVRAIDEEFLSRQGGISSLWVPLKDQATPYFATNKQQSQLMGCFSQPGVSTDWHEDSTAQGARTHAHIHMAFLFYCVVAFLFWTGNWLLNLSASATKVWAARRRNQGVLHDAYLFAQPPGTVVFIPRGIEHTVHTVGGFVGVNAWLCPSLRSILEACYRTKEQVYADVAAAALAPFVRTGKKGGIPFTAYTANRSAIPERVPDTRGNYTQAIRELEKLVCDFKASSEPAVKLICVQRDGCSHFAWLRPTPLTGQSLLGLYYQTGQLKGNVTVGGVLHRVVDFGQYGGGQKLPRVDQAAESYLKAVYRNVTEKMTTQAGKDIRQRNNPNMCAMNSMLIGAAWTWGTSGLEEALDMGRSTALKNFNKYRQSGLRSSKRRHQK
jgi:hypothetical protein